LFHHVLCYQALKPIVKVKESPEIADRKLCLGLFAIGVILSFLFSHSEPLSCHSEVASATE